MARRQSARKVFCCRKSSNRNFLKGYFIFSYILIFLNILTATFSINTISFRIKYLRPPYMISPD